MAITIKSIPTLGNKTASKFVSKAESALSKRATINFSKQVVVTTSILKKAKLK